MRKTTAPGAFVKGASTLRGGPGEVREAASRVPVPWHTSGWRRTAPVRPPRARHRPCVGQPGGGARPRPRAALTHPCYAPLLHSTSDTVLQGPGPQRCVGAPPRVARGSVAGYVHPRTRAELDCTTGVHGSRGAAMPGTAPLARPHAAGIARPTGTDGFLPPHAQEDALLKALICKHGARNWSVIAHGIHGRSGKSCRLRWCNQLNPCVKKEPFSEDEDAKIIAVRNTPNPKAGQKPGTPILSTPPLRPQAHKEHGNKWAIIARSLVGRCAYPAPVAWRGEPPVPSNRRPLRLRHCQDRQLHQEPLVRICSAAWRLYARIA